MSSSDVSAVTNYFSTAAEGFNTTLSSTITAAATSVPLTSTAGLTNGTVFVGIIEPGQTAQQTFTGTVDVSGSQITNVKWVRGANVGHAGGVTIVDYVSGASHNMMTAGILKQHTQTGTHTGVTTDTITVTSGSTLPAGDIGTPDLAAGAVTFPKLGAGATRLGLNNNGGGALTTGYQTFATLTATSTGGVCEAEFHVQANNANSGVFVTMDIQILCDGVAVTPASLSYNLPFISGASPNYSYSYTMSSTPAAGPHTWALQIKCNQNSTSAVANNQLKVSEVV